MNFANTIQTLTRRKVHKVEHDFGGDIGVNTVYIRELSYAKRADLFQRRFKPDGNGKFTLDLSSPDGGLYLNAEIVAETIVTDETGNKLIATKDAVLTWPTDLVDKLSELAFKTLDLLPKQDTKEESADPSPATS